MSNTITTASPKSVSYLRVLFEERYGRELTDETLADYPDQHAVSGAIKTILAAPDPGVEAPAELKAEVVRLGMEKGVTIVPGATLQAVNRQLNALRKDARIRSYHKGASNFEEFLASLKPEADEQAAGF